MFVVTFEKKAEEIVDAVLAHQGAGTGGPHEEVDRLLREACADYLKEITQTWQYKDWIDLPAHRLPIQSRIAAGNHVADWLRQHTKKLTESRTT